VLLYSVVIGLKGRPAAKKGGGFVFRVKIGEFEVEVGGSREEVLETVADLPSLLAGVSKAFESVKPKTVATLTVKTEGSKQDDALKQKYPKISQAESCDAAVLHALETDWGKWRPRTAEEIREALKSSGMQYEGRVLNGVLMAFVKKGVVRRWKTDAGYVYILAEKESLA